MALILTPSPCETCPILLLPKVPQGQTGVAGIMTPQAFAAALAATALLPSGVRHI